MVVNSANHCAVHEPGLDGAAVNDEAERLRVDASTASRFLDRSAGGDDARRAASERDRRRSSYPLTEYGRGRLLVLREMRVGLIERLTDGWSRKDVEQLISLLSLPDDAVIELGIGSGA